MSENIQPADQKPPAIDGATLWRRIKDHRIVQWAVGYVAVAYGIQHAVVLTGEAFEWPQLIQRVSMLLLALGLPLAMTLAWYHGDSANRRISGPELGILSTLVLIASMLFYVLVQPHEGGAPASTREASVTAARTAAADPHGTISVAVLPFVNLSSDKEQEFFSDGMTEEITSALAKVPDLRVVGRTSAFQFKGQNQDLRAIGQSLSATHLIEGSVRKAGDRVRITAQLIKAEDGTHLWTENYDRQLTDIFAIQEEIARAIATSLQMPLGLALGEQLVSSRTKDVESYQQFLRARALYRGRAISEAILLLEPALMRDPSYAPSWALLGDAYTFLPAYSGTAFDRPIAESRASVDSDLDKAEKAAREAIRLDPKHANGYASLAFARAVRMHWIEAEDLFQKALSLDPNDTEILDTYSQMLLASTGRLKEALAVRDQIKALEPFVPIYNTATADILRTKGDAQGAIRILESLSGDGPAGATRTSYLAHAYAVVGRYRDAADTLLTVTPVNDLDRKSLDIAVRLLRLADAKTTLTDALPETSYFGYYSFVGAPNRAVEGAERGIAVHYSLRIFNAVLWDPVNAALRKSEKYRAILSGAGFVDYWRAKGWPEFCHPVGADDFACE